MNLIEVKKVYKTLATTKELALLDNGPLENWTVDTSNMADISDEFSEKYLIPYLKIMQNFLLECA